MDSLATAAATAGQTLSFLHWGVLALTVAAGLFWTRLSHSPNLGETSFWLALTGGALFAAGSIQWAQPMLAPAVSDLAESLELASDLRDPLERIVIAVFDQALAVPALVVAFTIARVRTRTDSMLTAGQGFGIGYVAFELQTRLAGDFAIGLVPELIGPAVIGVALVSLRISTATLIAHAWLTKNYTIRFLQAAVISAAATVVLGLGDQIWVLVALVLLAMIAQTFSGTVAARRRRRNQSY